MKYNIFVQSRIPSNNNDKYKDTIRLRQNHCNANITIYYMS